MPGENLRHQPPKTRPNGDASHTPVHLLQSRQGSRQNAFADDWEALRRGRNPLPPKTTIAEWTAQ